MKKTKKILSLILAIIMIVSTMPMAFAYNFDYDAYMEEYLDFTVYTSNIYTAEGLTSYEVSIALVLAYGTALESVMTTYPEIAEAFGFPEKLDKIPEAADALTAALKEVNSTVEKNIADGTFVVIIDTRKAISSYYKVSMTHTIEEMEALLAKVPAELTEKAEASAVACDDIITNAALDPTSYTQADYDKAAADMIEYYTQFTACLDGIHDYAYLTNGDADHTATCEFCTETTTSAHSYTAGKCICGEKEPVADDDNTDVENPDDNTGADDNTQEEPAPQNFFQKIIEFFKNLFAKLFGWMKK